MKIHVYTSSVSSNSVNRSNQDKALQLLKTMKVDVIEHDLATNHDDLAFIKTTRAAGKPPPHIFNGDKYLGTTGSIDVGVFFTSQSLPPTNINPNSGVFDFTLHLHCKSHCSSAINHSTVENCRTTFGKELDNLALSIHFDPAPDQVVIGQSLTIQCRYAPQRDSKRSVSIFLHCPLGPWNAFCFQNCQSACATEKEGQCPNEVQLGTVRCQTQTKHNNGQVIIEYVIPRLSRDWLYGAYKCQAAGSESDSVMIKEKATQLLPSVVTTTPTSKEVATTNAVVNVPDRDLILVHGDRQFEERTSTITRDLLIVCAIIFGFLSLLLNLFCCIRCILIRQYSKSNGPVRMQHLFCMRDEIQTARLRRPCVKDRCYGVASQPLLHPQGQNGFVLVGDSAQQSIVNGGGSYISGLSPVPVQLVPQQQLFQQPHQLIGGTGARGSLLVDASSDLERPASSTLYHRPGSRHRATPTRLAPSGYVSPDLLTSSIHPGGGSLGESSSTLDRNNHFHQQQAPVYQTYQMANPSSSTFCHDNLQHHNQYIAQQQPTTYLLPGTAIPVTMLSSNTPSEVAMINNQQQRYQVRPDNDATSSLTDSFQCPSSSQIDPATAELLLRQQQGSDPGSSSISDPLLQHLVSPSTNENTRADLMVSIEESSNQAVSRGKTDPTLKSNSHDSGKALSLIGEPSRGHQPVSQSTLGFRSYLADPTEPDQTKTRSIAKRDSTGSNPVFNSSQVENYLLSLDNQSPGASS